MKKLRFINNGKNILVIEKEGLTPPNIQHTVIIENKTYIAIEVIKNYDMNSTDVLLIK